MGLGLGVMTFRVGLGLKAWDYNHDCANPDMPLHYRGFRLVMSLVFVVSCLTPKTKEFQQQ